MKLQKKLLVTGMILLGTSLSASATNMDYEDIKNNKIICKPSVGQTTVVQNVIFDLDEKSIIVEKNGISTKVLTENQPRNFPWEAENQNVQKYLQNSWLKVSQNNNDEIIVSLNLKLKGGGGISSKPLDESKPKNAYNVGLGQTNIESQTQPITGNHFLLLYDRIANSNQQLANNNERMAQKLAEEETKKEQFKIKIQTAKEETKKEQFKIKIQTAKEIFNTNLAEFKECEKNMKECFKPSNTLYQECKNPPCDLEFKKTLLLKSQDNVDFLLKQSSFDNKKI